MKLSYDIVSYTIDTKKLKKGESKNVESQSNQAYESTASNK